MDKTDARKQVTEMLSQQAKLGAKRYEIVLVLAQRNFTERQIGLIMEIHQKTVAAMKQDGSKSGRKKWKVGSRTHRDASSAQLKRVNGKKILGQFIEKCKKLIVELESKGE